MEDKDTGYTVYQFWLLTDVPPGPLSISISIGLETCWLGPWTKQVVGVDSIFLDKAVQTGQEKVGEWRGSNAIAKKPFIYSAEVNTLDHLLLFRPLVSHFLPLLSFQ